MFVAHIPAGYLTGKYLHSRFAASDVAPKWFVLAAVIGAIVPDLDLFYFFLIDHRRTPHHLYWPHFPLVWALLLAASAAWLVTAKRKGAAALAVVFCLGGFGHLMLDTIVGDIHWGAPFVYGPFSLFTVQALYKPWWLNFILHWSFAFELLLLGWAVLVWRRQ
jgi:hypothetical protein